MLANAAPASSTPREETPWRRRTDSTSSGVPIHGRVKEPGLTLGRACKVHRIAAKRVRRKVDGVNRKVWLCTRGERAA
jgi:hypothetical protein